MATVTGDVAVLLDVLGCRQGNSRILEAITLVGPAMEVAEFDFDGEISLYYTFRSSGTDLLFENDVLVSVMVRTQPDSQDDTYGVYPRPEALVEGLSPIADRADVTAVLGSPERIGPNFDLYAVNGRFLHVEFDPHDRLAMLSALLEAT